MREGNAEDGARFLAAKPFKRVSSYTIGYNLPDRMGLSNIAANACRNELASGVSRVALTATHW